MLTGHPPFDGETPAEVLMKHQLDTPNLGKVPSTIRPVLERALEKDPTRRFQSVMEFARAVDGVYGGPRVDAPPVAPPPLNGKPPIPDTVVDERRIAGQGDSRGSSGCQFLDAERFPGTTHGTRRRLRPGAGRVSGLHRPVGTPQHRDALGRARAGLSALHHPDLVLVLVGRLRRRPEKNPWARRSVHLAIGMGVGLLAFWLDGWAVPRGTADATSNDLVFFSGHRIGPETFGTAMRYLFYFGLSVAACRWWVVSDRRRKERVRLFPTIAAAFWAGVFLFLWPFDSTPVIVGIAPLVIAAIAVQAASPWTPPPPPVPAVRVRPRARPAYA